MPGSKYTVPTAIGFHSQESDPSTDTATGFA
jgi:hypothetical protein